jgi:hypothetical protein
MTRCYVNPDPDVSSGLTEGNVVLAIRDRAAEAMSERQRFPRAVSDAGFCGYIEYLLNACGRHDKFKTHPEKKTASRSTARIGTRPSTWTSSGGAGTRRGTNTRSPITAESDG